jgi:hypothetical protein
MAKEDNILSKEDLIDKIIPALLYNKDGKEILKNVQITLDAKGKSFSKIKEQFKNNKIYDISIWNEFIQFFNETFNSEVKEVSSLNNETLSNLINKLRRIQFDFVFVEDDSKKIDNSVEFKKKFKEYLDSKKGIVELHGDKVERYIVPQEKNYSVNIDYNQPKELKSYPNVLIKIEDQKISLNSSSKRIMSNIINKLSKIEQDGEEVRLLIDYFEESFESLDVDVRGFFGDLREDGFYIKNVRFDNPKIYFNMGLKDLIDYEQVINTNYYMTSKLDFINIKIIKLAYTKSIKNKLKDFLLTIDFIKYPQSIKFNIKFNKNKLLTSEIQKEILNKLEINGIKKDISYEFPVEYFLNKLLQDFKKTKQYYDEVLKIDSKNKTIENLGKNKIINFENGEISLDTDKLQKHKKKLAKELIAKKIIIGSQEIQIMGVTSDNRQRVILEIRIIDNNSNLTETYNVYLKSNLVGYASIISIILPSINEALIYSNIIKNDYDVVLKYIGQEVINYRTYEYNIKLERYANNAHNYLTKYSKNHSKLEEKEAKTKLGDKVEKQVNILLKFLYRNYKLIGGSKKPDGYLYLSEGERSFVLDSKQHKNIKAGEFDKLARYLFTYCKNAGLPEAKIGVLVISRNKLEKSLNQSARDSWKNCDEFNDKFKIGFISIEYLLELFVLFKSNRANSNQLLKKAILDSFNDIVSKSVDFVKSDLITLEDKKLKQLKDEIKEEKYLPSRDKEL